MPVHDAIAMRVNTGAHELGTDWLTTCVGLFKRASEFRQRLQTLLIADVRTERGMPVIVRRWRADARAGPGLARVDDEGQTKHGDNRNDERKNGAALKANLLAFALLSELGDFFGG